MSPHVVMVGRTLFLLASQSLAQSHRGSWLGPAGDSIWQGAACGCVAQQVLGSACPQLPVILVPCSLSQW